MALVIAAIDGVRTIRGESNIAPGQEDPRPSSIAAPEIRERSSATAPTRAAGRAWAW